MNAVAHGFSKLFPDIPQNQIKQFQYTTNTFFVFKKKQKLERLAYSRNELYNVASNTVC